MSNYIDNINIEGIGTTPIDGCGCIALRNGSVIIGDLSINVSNPYKTIIGKGLIETGKDGCCIFGKYNKEDSSAVFIIGNGSSSSSRHNALVIRANGDIIIDGEKQNDKFNVTREAIITYPSGMILYAAQGTDAYNNLKGDSGWKSERWKDITKDSGREKLNVYKFTRK